MTNWIEWNGGECPVPAGTIVDVKYRDGDEETNHAGSWIKCWVNDGMLQDIIAYRIHTDAPNKLEALRKAIEPLLSASKADPNAKKGRGTDGLWLTINLRQSDYEAIVKAYNEIT